MPFPNEHACRLRDPGDFQDGSFRSQSRDHDGKEYRVIMGRLKGKDTMTDQAYRYKKDTWSASSARSHCSSHNGSFEAASESSDRMLVDPNAALYDEPATPPKLISLAQLETLFQRGMEFLREEFDAPESSSAPNLPAGAKAGETTGAALSAAASSTGRPVLLAPGPMSSDTSADSPASPVGRFVSWTSAAVVLRGRVEECHRSGVVRQSDKSPGIVATEKSPAVVVRIYEEHDGGWRPTERSIVRSLAQLTTIGELRRPRAFAGLKVNQRDGETAEMLIYADIAPDGYGGVSAKQVHSELKRLKGHKYIDLRINSGGGDAFEGMAIYNQLANFQIQQGATITAYVDGMCASAATLVACACRSVKAMQHSFYMVHRAWAMAIGNANDFGKVVELLLKVDEDALAIYRAQTNMSIKELIKLIDDETYMTAAEAHAFGFVDEVLETDAAVNVSLGARRVWFRNPPDELVKRMGPVEGKLMSRALAA